MERFGAGFHRAMRRWQAGRTAAALDRLDDDTLKDIGIARAEIPAFARRVTAAELPAAGKVAGKSRSTFNKELTT
jgi:uncharacterized protein YjiS (DUF1127 family)